METQAFKEKGIGKKGGCHNTDIGDTDGRSTLRPGHVLLAFKQRFDKDDHSKEEKDQSQAKREEAGTRAADAAEAQPIGIEGNEET